MMSGLKVGIHVWKCCLLSKCQIRISERFKPFKKTSCRETQRQGGHLIALSGTTVSRLSHHEWEGHGYVPELFPVPFGSVCQGKGERLMQSSLRA